MKQMSYCTVLGMKAMMKVNIINLKRDCASIIFVMHKNEKMVNAKTDNTLGRHTVLRNLIPNWTCS